VNWDAIGAIGEIAGAVAVIVTLGYVAIDELFRFTLLIRHYANHVYKLFRLYERGVYPESEWRNTLAEAVQLFATPGMAEFRATNRFYADLWAAMEGIAPEDFSSFEFARRSPIADPLERTTGS